MRMTRQRKILLDVLDQLSTPGSADEIAAEVHQRDPVIALSTVYRNLDKLLESGELILTRFQDGIARYERTGDTHRHYLICTRCGLRQTIDACPLHSLQTELESSTGFLITDHQISLYGLCPACQKNH